jgi:hypothetical protein
VLTRVVKPCELEMAWPHAHLSVGHNDDVLSTKVYSVNRVDVARVMVAALDMSSTAGPLQNLRFDLCAGAGPATDAEIPALITSARWPWQ